MFYILTTSDWGAYFKRVLALLHIARTTVVTIAIAVERLLLFVGFAANVFQLHVYNNLKGLIIHHWYGMMVLHQQTST